MRATLLLLLAACSRSPDRHDVGDVAAAAPPVDSAPVAVSTVDAAPAMLEGAWSLDLVAPDGTRLGVASIPVGAREPRPVVVALHGGSDRPEWACSAWRGVTNGHAFVVCPRGIGADASLAWGALADTKARIARAVAATREIHARWMLDADPVLVGFSMGATQAANLAADEPKSHRRIVLAESSYAPEPIARFTNPWTKGGGERVVFLCSTPGCGPVYRRAAAEVARRGVPARLNLAGTMAHGMWPEVIASMRRDLPWLVEGLPGWEHFAPPAEETPGKTELLSP